MQLCPVKDLYRLQCPFHCAGSLRREITHQNPRGAEGVGQALMVQLIPSVESKKKCQHWQKQGGRATSHNVQRERKKKRIRIAPFSSNLPASL